jgi:hypothetical protein
MADGQPQPTQYSGITETFSPAPASTSTTPAVSGGLLIHLDAKGRPTTDKNASRGTVTIPANNNSGAGLVARDVVKNGKAMKVIDLQGRFKAYSVATIGADGKPVIGCIAPNDVPTSGCQEKSSK